MARKIRDAALETRTARAKLTRSEEALLEADSSGAAPRLPANRARGRAVDHQIVRWRGWISGGSLALADDFQNSGPGIMDFFAAQNACRVRHAELAHPDTGSASRPYLVSDAVADHLGFMEAHRKSANDARYRARLIPPELAETEVSKLTAKMLRQWLLKLSQTPPRLRTRAGEPQRSASCPTIRRPCAGVGRAPTAHGTFSKPRSTGRSRKVGLRPTSHGGA